MKYYNDMFHGPPLIESWGAPTWIALHSIAFSYSERPTPDERVNMLRFLRSLARVLPCKKCRQHCAAYIDEHIVNVRSPPLRSNASLSEFVTDLHNAVNRRLQKPTIDHEEVVRMYLGRHETTATAAPSAARAIDVEVPMLLLAALGLICVCVVIRRRV